MELETNLITTNFDHDFPIKPQGAQTQSFLLSNGVNHAADENSFHIAGIEMVPLQSLTYISLRDLLPALPPPSVLWPTYNRGDSWREIPIRDPLVQHAAWAYLQPMSTAHEDAERGLLGKLKDGCGGLLGCFGGFWDDVVWRPIKSLLFSENVDDDARSNKVD